MLATVGIPQGIANVYKVMRGKFFVLQGMACGEACPEKMTERYIFIKYLFCTIVPYSKTLYIWSDLDTEDKMWILHFYPCLSHLHHHLLKIILKFVDTWGNNLFRIMFNMSSFYYSSCSFKLFSVFFLELYFWVPSVNWYVNRKEFLLKKRYKYIIIVQLGLESEKNPICYQLLPWSICYKIFPGEFCQEKKLLFLLFAHDNLRSVPVWNINYMFILVMTIILSFSSVLILHEITIPRQLCYHWRTEHKPYPRLCTMKIFRMRHRETE